MEENNQKKHPLSKDNRSYTSRPGAEERDALKAEGKLRRHVLSVEVDLNSIGRNSAYSSMGKNKNHRQRLEMEESIDLGVYIEEAEVSRVAFPKL